jgi:nucleotide-binding universal stress UspA family protein
VVVQIGPREAQLPTPTAAEAGRTLPAFKLKKILVPVDFSDCSKKALEYAIPFARQFDAELTLLLVLRPYTPMLEMGSMDVETVEDANKALEGLRGLVDRAVRSGTAMRRGEPHVEIIKFAKEFGIDLIILSTHGHTGVARVLLGSTTEKVVRHAGCPVLVVREHEHEFVAGEL